MDLPLIVITAWLNAVPAAISQPCTLAEVEHYEAQGWDAYECHGDKAMQTEDAYWQRVENLDTKESN